MSVKNDFFPGDLVVYDDDKKHFLRIIIATWPASDIENPVIVLLINGEHETFDGILKYYKKCL